MCPFPADCIANYGNHAENMQHSSETAIYSDVNLSNKLSEIKMFPNSSMCYTSPDGDSSATYEPIPYATTQLIQANIKNKAAASGAIAEPLDRPCWKQQPPNLPPIPKEMAAQMQYNITEQNMLIKGKLWFHLACLKKTKENKEGKKNLFLYLQIIYKEVKEPSIPKLSTTTPAVITTQEAHARAQTEVATAPQVTAAGPPPQDLSKYM